MIVVNRKVKGSRKCAIKRKVKFENYKNYLEATQLENKIIIQKQKQTENDKDSITKNNQEFMKNNKLILKKQQRFQSERHNVFTEEIGKVDLSSNDVKRMQLTASIETYAFGANKDLVSEREEIKYNNIKKLRK